MIKVNLQKYNINCSKEKTRPIYKKRYKNNGEEYLKKVDSIDIKEDMKEKQLEINRVKEIFNIKERLKAEELIDEITNEEYLEHLKELEKIEEMDTYEFLNKTMEIKELYNRMPEEIREKYKNISKFTKEYLPQFINEKTKEIEEEKQRIEEENKQKQPQITNEELQKQIEELKLKYTGEKENV